MTPSATISNVRDPGYVLRISRTDALVWGIAISGILTGAAIAPFDLRVYPGAIAVLSLAPLFVRLDRQTMPDMLFGPAAFMYLFHVMGYAAGPIGQVYVSGLLQVNVTEFEEGLILAQWGCVLGLVTFAVVYPMVFRCVPRLFHQRPQISDEVKGKEWSGYGVTMLVAASAIIVYGFITGAGNRLARVEDVSIGASTAYAAFQYVHQAMFFFLGFAAAYNRKGWTVLWITVLLSYSLFFFLDGGRGVVAMAWLLSAIGWMAGGTSTRRIIAVLIVAGIAFIPLSGVVNKYRDSFLDRPGGLIERWSGFIQSSKEFITETSAEEYGTADIFLERITTFSVDRVFVLTPREIPFAGWEGIENVLYAFIPRIVLPDRPEVSDGNELAIRYGAAIPDTTGSYMPAVGDGYRRFGWPGIVLIYAFSASLFGAVASAAYRLRSRREWMAMLVFIIISSTEVMINTLQMHFYLLFWVFPKYLMFFYLLRLAQDRIYDFSRKTSEG